MLIETYFSDSDTTLIEQKYAKFKKVMWIAIAGVVIVGLVLAFLLYDKLAELFIPVFAVILLLDFLVIRFVFLKVLKHFEKDVPERIKLKGEVMVVKKEKYKESYSLSIDDNDLKSISVPQSSFSEIQEGDQLEIEVTKYAHVLISLKKDGKAVSI